MVAALLGVFFVILFCAALAAAMYGVHRLARQKTALDIPISHALRELAPRGGRHRFSVRLFEVGFLAAIWMVAITLVVLWLPLASSPLQEVAAVATASFGVLMLTTWWAWRRGVLRGTDVQRALSPLQPTQRQARK